MKNEKGITITTLIFIVVLAVFALAVIIAVSSNNGTNTEKPFTTSTTSPKNKSYGLGDTFTFDGFTITIGTNYSFSTIDNHYSDYNGRYVIALPVTVTNNNSETSNLNMFYYNFFGSKGTQLPGVSSYFEDSLDFAGGLRSGAKYTKNMYILYDGNGLYSIEFDNLSEKVNVEFKVTK